MTWRWWIVAVLAAAAVELLARTRSVVWADRIALTMLGIAAVHMVVRRYRERT